MRHPFWKRPNRRWGFPIEVIAGREEARLIYLGVAHTLARPETRQLVVDIGGGSTEFIIGQNIDPVRLESLYMGCVSFSLRFFPDGKVDKRSLQGSRARGAARAAEPSCMNFAKPAGMRRSGRPARPRPWSDLLELNGWSDHGLTRDGLEKLRSRADRGRWRVAAETGRPAPGSRYRCLPGGLAIMSAVFKEFGLERMVFSEGALRLGVLYDLLGRHHHDDLRESHGQPFHAALRRRPAPGGAGRPHRRSTLLQATGSRPAAPPSHGRMRSSWSGRRACTRSASRWRTQATTSTAPTSLPTPTCPDSRGAIRARLSRLVLAHRGKLERAQPLRGEAPEWTLIFLFAHCGAAASLARRSGHRRRMRCRVHSQRLPAHARRRGAQRPADDGGGAGRTRPSNGPASAAN
jgi:exopolyphosphatase/guanosine-5'-triphosphate,3'-diphosphate pyrophosphatase